MRPISLFRLSRLRHSLSVNRYQSTVEALLLIQICFKAISRVRSFLFQLTASSGDAHRRITSPHLRNIPGAVKDLKSSRFKVGSLPLADEKESMVFGSLQVCCSFRNYWIILVVLLRQRMACLINSHAAG